MCPVARPRIKGRLFSWFVGDAPSCCCPIRACWSLDEKKAPRHDPAKHIRTVSSINDLFGSEESDSEAERDAERGTSAAAGGDARTLEDEDEDENDEDDSGEGAAAVDGYVPPAGT